MYPAGRPRKMYYITLHYMYYNLLLLILDIKYYSVLILYLKFDRFTCMYICSSYMSLYLLDHLYCFVNVICKM
jgi:hypothetical protein